MGAPPPNAAAEEFGIYAGSIIQRADTNAIIIVSILIIGAPQYLK
jgi:hypothetical protein